MAHRHGHRHCYIYHSLLRTHGKQAQHTLILSLFGTVKPCPLPPAPPSPLRPLMPHITDPFTSSRNPSHSVSRHLAGSSTPSRLTAPSSTPVISVSSDFLASAARFS